MEEGKSFEQLGDIPDVLTATKYEKPLQHHLHVQPPSSLDDGAPVLSFERLREIEIPWDRIFETVVTDSQQSSLTPLKEYIEQSWQLSAGELPAKILDSVTEIPEGSTPPLFYAVEFEVPEGEKEAKAKAVPVPKGIVLTDGYGRHHLCRPVEGEEITKNDFASPESYAHLWQEKLQGVELCFVDPDSALRGHTKVEYIDLAAKFIADAYHQIRAQNIFGKDFHEKLKESSKKMVENALDTGMDVDEINRIQELVATLRLGRFRIRRRFERLVNKAAELGYLLVLEETPREGPDKTPLEPLKRGELYNQFKRLYNWTTTIERVERRVRRRGIFRIKRTEIRRWQEKKTHAQVIDDFRKVDVNENILLKKINQLRNEDHREVFVFDKTPKGYFTADGTSLREVMFRCERDEAFRCRCAVFLPVIEKAFSGYEAISGYNAFIAPFPGIVPIDLPKLSIRESLSYRLAWQETQLGEVVNAVNLAPGESRTITVRRSYEQETTTSQKRTTIFDLQESDTTDMATEMEREASNESQSSSSSALSVSASASASYCGVSASSSVSHDSSQNKSLKAVSRNMGKMAKKASHSVNRSCKDEVSTDTRQSTKISNYDEYTSTIKNINEGRTLNLLFYRLYNRFESGLYLDDVEFLVTPSVEIIAGSGIHDSVSFDATEFDRLLDEFGVSRLPLDMDEINELRYKRFVVEEFENILAEEYGEQVKALTFGAIKDWLSELFPRKSSNPAKVEENARKEWEESLGEDAKTQNKQKLLEATREHFESRKKHMEERLKQIKLEGNCIGKQDLQIVARGLYIDAQVGAVPSTENYSERMREQMVALKKAEVALTRADASYRESLARQLGQNGGNWIVGVMPCRESNSLILNLKFPLADGGWDLLLDGKKLCEIPPEQLGNYKLSLDLRAHQDWLDDDGLLNRRLELHNRDKGMLVGLV